MRLFTFFALLTIAGAALAHESVINPVVLARMHGMSTIDDAMKVLSGMAKQDTAFDRAAAGAARDVLVAETNRLPDLFRPNESDPKSEARPGIWTNPDAFELKVSNAILAAEALDTATLQDLQAGLINMGLACKGCHDDFRQ